MPNPLQHIWISYETENVSLPYVRPSSRLFRSFTTCLWHHGWLWFPGGSSFACRHHKAAVALPKALRNRLNSQIPFNVSGASFMLHHCVVAVGGGEFVRPCLMGIHPSLQDQSHPVWCKGASRVRFSVYLEGFLKGGISFSASTVR